MNTATIVERGILFKGPLVVALREGRKTQTRRPIERIRGFGSITEFGRTETEGYDWCFRDRRRLWQELTTAQLLDRCPYGRPGDRLWVRETWTTDHADFYPHFPILYRADWRGDYERNDRGEVYSPEAKRWYPFKWRPSIFMPRHVSRLTLELTSVEVVYLESITGRDVLAEGIDNGASNPTMGVRWENMQRMAFAELWDNLHGRGVWARTDFVWKLGVKVVEDRTR